MILKEKAARFQADGEIQALIAEINVRNPRLEKLCAKYTQEHVAGIKACKFDRQGLGARGIPYERLDQLTMELLMGVR